MTRLSRATAAFILVATLAACGTQAQSPSSQAIYVAPQVTPFWGSDWLGSEDILKAGESVSLSLPPTAYDLRFDDCDQETLITWRSCCPSESARADCS